METRKTYLQALPHTFFMNDSFSFNHSRNIFDRSILEVKQASLHWKVLENILYFIEEYSPISIVLNGGFLFLNFIIICNNKILGRFCLSFEVPAQEMQLDGRKNS
jgi:hypothetical protein